MILYHEACPDVDAETKAVLQVIHTHHDLISEHRMYQCDGCGTLIKVIIDV